MCVGKFKLENGSHDPLESGEFMCRLRAHIVVRKHDRRDIYMRVRLMSRLSLSGSGLNIEAFDGWHTSLQQ